MSPRAAWRLGTLGFEQVYDYAAGKVDWGAAGLRREGTVAQEQTAGDAADADVPTCSLGDELPVVRARVRAREWDQCIVVDEQRIVLGRLGRKALAAEDDRTVETAMQEGPSTVRPNVRLAEIEQQLERHGRRNALVTTSDGKLVGVIRRPPSARPPG